MLIPYLQIRSKSIIQYNLSDDNGRFLRTDRQKSSAEKLKDQKTYTGTVRPGAKKRLTKAIENIVLFSSEKKILLDTGINIKFKINFITLTIHSPDRMIDQKEAHKNLLEPFLLWLKRKHGCTMYIWKAELQGRGQLHYHLTTDCYIPWMWIRDKWNSLQQPHGYLDCYYAEHGHYNANSTDVHAVYKEKDIVGYIKKQVFKASDEADKLKKEVQVVSLGGEMTKDIQNLQSVGGKVWDCSLNLKSVGYLSTVAHGETEFRLNNEVSKGNVDVIKTDHCFIYDFKQRSPLRILSREDKQEFEKLRKELIFFERKKPEKKENNEYNLQEYQKTKVNFKPELSLFSKS